MPCSMPRYIVLAGVITCLLGCAPDAPEFASTLQRSAGGVDDSPAVIDDDSSSDSPLSSAASLELEVVPERSEASTSQSLPEWSFDPVLRIGSLDDSPYALVRIGGLVVSPRTGVIVMTQFDEIRVFDSGGRYLRTIGRRGQGPGEFERASRIGWVGELLVAYDAIGRRVTYFTEDGAVVDTRRLESEPMGVQDLRSSTAGTLFTSATPIAVLSDGYYLLRYGGAVGETPASMLEAVPVVRSNGAGDDLIVDHLDIRNTAAMSFNGAFFQPPIAWQSLYSTDPRGSRVTIVHQMERTDGGETWFRVRTITETGQEVFARNYSYVPRPLSSATEDSLLNVQMSSGIPQRFGARESDMRRLLRVPRFDPAVSDVVTGVDGSIWLRREAHGVNEALWWILNPGGDLVGQVRLPITTRVLYTDGDIVWTADSDELDVTYAVQLRLNKN